MKFVIKITNDERKVCYLNSSGSVKTTFIAYVLPKRALTNINKYPSAKYMTSTFVTVWGYIHSHMWENTHLASVLVGLWGLPEKRGKGAALPGAESWAQSLVPSSFSPRAPLFPLSRAI